MGSQHVASADPPHTDLLGAKPDVPHVVADGLGSRHGAGQLPGLDDGRAALLHRLQEEEEKVLTAALLLLTQRARRQALTEMNPPLSHASSLTASYTGVSVPCRSTLPWWTSGYWVEEWFPQMMTFFTLSEETPQRMATCRRAADTASHGSN